MRGRDGAGCQVRDVRGGVDESRGEGPVCDGVLWAVEVEM